MKKIKYYEPVFFILFGLFHLHRIWGLIDRKAYADFWIGILNNKGLPYYSIMGVLAFLCILGMVTFFKNLHNNYWWRYIYLFGGVYVLFDLFAIATGLKFWHELLLKMFDISSPYWNVIWSMFVLLGGAVFILGLIITALYKFFSFFLKKTQHFTTFYR